MTFEELKGAVANQNFSKVGDSDRRTVFDEGYMYYGSTDSLSITHRFVVIERDDESMTVMKLELDGKVYPRNVLKTRIELDEDEEEIAYVTINEERFKITTFMPAHYH